MSKKDEKQKSVVEFFAKKRKFQDDVDDKDDDSDARAAGELQSKHKVLIDMELKRVKRENGINWTFLFDFDIHFLGRAPV